MNSTALVPVFTGTIQNQPAQLCNARDLHTFLEVGDRFDQWISRRIEQYGFADGEDFCTVLCKTSKRGGRPATDYQLTLDMAKELSMVENNEKGRQVRRYFIALERSPQPAPQALPPADLSLTDLALRQQKAMEAANVVASAVQLQVFKQLSEGAAGFSHERYLLSFGFSSTGAVPTVRKIERDAEVASLSRLAEMISYPGGMLPSNADLANLAKACNDRLALRIGNQIF